MRTILVTGASRGLGQVVAQHLAKQGNRLVLMGRNRQRLEQVAVLCGPEHRIQVVDFDEILNWHGAHLGDIDAVVHCAGGGLGFRTALISAYEMRKLWMLNLGAAIEINRFALLGMIERRAGHIVHVCSIASGEGVGSVGYNTVKAGLAAYVRSVGREVARHGVVVTGVAPGAFQCPGNAMERLQASSPDAYKNFVENRLPRGVMGSGDEILPVIDLLLSPGASMLGGAVIPVDAGEGRYYSMP